MAHIVVVGSLNMDLVVRVPHMPVPGETILGSNFETIPGGKGANQAVGAARMGAKVSMIGCVGDDEFGQALVGNLQNEGVDISHISISSSDATGIAMITLDEKGQNSIVVASGANMALTPEDVRKAWEVIEDIDLVVMPLEVSLPCIEETVRLASKDLVKVVLNPAPAQILSDEILQNVDVLVPNESETSLLTGMDLTTTEEADQAAAKLLEKGPGTIVLTLGSRGSLLVTPNKASQIFEPYQVEVVDTTAAGDAFVAALSVGLADDLSFEDAVQQANAAGALAVTKMGAQPCMPTLDEVKKLIQSREEL